MSNGAAVVYRNVLSAEHRDAVEAAVPVGRRFESVEPWGWAWPVERAIRTRADQFLRSFPAARRAIGADMAVEGGSALWRGEEGGRSGEDWHTDRLPRSSLYALWYGGEFEGGELETEAGLFAPARNSLLVFWPGAPHRVLPVRAGARLSVHCVLSRWSMAKHERARGQSVQE